ncbi:MAG: hypothetical protein AB7G21_09835 [Dehalococcoidia bacterium]
MPLVSAILAAGALALAGCGGAPTVAERTADEAPAVVESADRAARLTVVTSALPQGVRPADLTVEAVPAEPLPGDLTPLPGYRLGPSGTVFAEPLPFDIEMTIPPGSAPGVWLVPDGGDAAAAEPLRIVEVQALGPGGTAQQGPRYRVRVLVPHFSIIRPHLHQERFVRVEHAYSLDRRHVGDSFEIEARVSSPVATWDFYGGGAYELSTPPGPWTFTGRWLVFGAAVVQRDTGRSIAVQPVAPIRRDGREVGFEMASPATPETYEQQETARTYLGLTCVEPGEYSVSYNVEVRRPVAWRKVLDRVAGSFGPPELRDDLAWGGGISYLGRCHEAAATATPAATPTADRTATPARPAPATTTPGTGSTPTPSGPPAGAPGGITCVTFLGQTTCTDASGRQVPPPSRP